MESVKTLLSLGRYFSSIRVMKVYKSYIIRNRHITSILLKDINFQNFKILFKTLIKIYFEIFEIKLSKF